MVEDITASSRSRPLLGFQLRLSLLQPHCQLICNGWTSSSGNRVSFDRLGCLLRIFALPPALPQRYRNNPADLATRPWSWSEQMHSSICCQHFLPQEPAHKQLHRGNLSTCQGHTSTTRAVEATKQQGCQSEAFEPICPLQESGACCLDSYV